MRKTKISPVQTALIGVALLVVFYIGVTGYLIATNYDNIILALRRRDMMEALRRVEQSERAKLIMNESKIKKESVKHILSPLVINN